MPRTTGAKNIPRSIQRAITLDALRGVRTSDIMNEYDVSRHTVSKLRREAETDPESRVQEARGELEYWMEVAEILGYS